MYKVNVLLELVFAAMLLVQHAVPENSSYSYMFDTLYCNNTMYMRGCRHEIGHKMDRDLGRPSESPKFVNAVKLYLEIEQRKSNPSELSEMLRSYPNVYGGSIPSYELYAAIYAWTDGNVFLLPEILRQFFSNDLKYLSLYNCLTKELKINICDTIHFSYLKGE